MFPHFINLKKLGRLPVKMKSMVLADKKHIFTSDNVTTHKILAKDDHYITAIKINEEYKSILKLRSHLHTQTLMEVENVDVIAVGFNNSEGIFILITNQEVRLYDDELRQVAMYELECIIITALINYNGDTIAIYLDSGKLTTIKINSQPDYGFMVFREAVERTLQGNVSIGWGSAVTQFKKSSKDQLENKETERKFQYLNNTHAWFDWSRNNLLIVNTLLAPDTYALRIFNERCELQQCSKPKTHKGLDGPIAINPCGTVIAVSIWLENDKQRISFLNADNIFELTDRMEPDIGLRVELLSWSSCSEYLVAYKKPVTEKAVSSCVDIYASSNDTWTMGTRINMGLMELQHFTIVESSPNLMSIDLHFEKNIYRYYYIQKNLRSNNIINNRGVIAVINNKRVNVHIPEKEIKAPKFEEANYSLPFQDIVLTVVFDQLNYRFAVVEVSNCISIYSYDTMEPKLEKTMTLPDLRCEEPICYVSFYFNQDTFVSVGSRGMHWGRKLETDNEMSVVLNTDPPTMYTRFIDFDDLYQLPAQPIPLLEVCPLSKKSRISLNTNYCLMLDDVLIDGRFTSFITQDFLYLATYHRDCETNADELLLFDQTSLNRMRDGHSIFEVAFRRNIKLGAVLVTAITETSQVVMQLPRGNLELVEVQGITLMQLRSLLFDRSYEEIYNLITQQSLGLDLLVDIDPELFIENVGDICTNVLPKTVLVKFIMELSDDNTLSSEDIKIMHVNRCIPNKRKIVCNAIYDALVNLNNNFEYLPPLICTAMCNKNIGYDIPAALEMIQFLCKENYKSYRTQIKFTLDLLFNYIDYQELYTQALYVYNIYIAELVAEKSNMDPKIYREQFKLFKVEDQDLMRFRINAFLNEHHRAVPYMSILFDKKLMEKIEVLNYAKRNTCLNTLYELVSPQSPLFLDLSKLYAESLADHGKNAEAGLVLQRAKLHAAAFRYYMKAKMWKQCLICLNQAKLKPAALREYQMSLAGNLKSCGMHSEAAIVFMEYLHEVDLAVQCLYDVKNFTEALRYIHQGKEESLIELTLIPRLFAHMNEQYDTYRSKEKHLKAYYLQIKDYVVRVQTNEHRNSVIFKGEDYDTFSDVLSVRTFKSTLTSTSSVRSMRRRTRKFEKKCNDTREGSQYENVALIIKMHDIINEVNVIANDIISCSILYSSIANKKKIMEFIHSSYMHLKDSEKYIAELCADIWSPALRKGTYENDPRYYNIQTIDVKYRVTPEGFGYQSIPLFNYK